MATPAGNIIFGHEFLLNRTIFVEIIDGVYVLLTLYEHYLLLCNLAFDRAQSPMRRRNS